MHQLITALYVLVFLGMGLPAEIYAMSPLRAGVASECITPDEPLTMQGYGNRTVPFTGVHDDLFVRTVALESEGQEALIISLEVCMVGHWLWRMITDDIGRSTGIPREHILLNTSHTHGGPALQDSLAWKVPSDSSPETIRYTNQLRQKILSTVEAARNAYQPARLGFGMGETFVGINRRAQMADGEVRLEPDPSGPVDHSLPVIRIEDMTGRALAILFEQSTHGTVMGGKNLEVTGDWCGLASQYVEETWGQNIQAVFLSGAAGDVNPIHKNIEDLKSNRQYARTLGQWAGDEVMRVARDVSQFSGGPIQGLQRVVNVPGKVPRETGVDGPDVPIRLSVLQIGNIVLTGASGEIFSEIGMAVKNGSPYRHTIFLGNCNGYSGYVPTDDEYSRGGYEIEVSPVKSGGEAAIVSTLLTMLSEL